MLTIIIEFFFIGLFAVFIPAIYDLLRNEISVLPKVKFLQYYIFISTMIYSIVILIIFGDDGLTGILESYAITVVILNAFYLFINKCSLEDNFLVLLLVSSIILILALDLSLNENQIYYLILK